MTLSRLLSLALIAVTGSVAAHADSFQFNYSGVGFTANGTFTGTLTKQPNVYQITEVSGTRNGAAITGLDPGLDYVDDLLYYPPSNTGTAQPVSYVDNFGIAYLAGGKSYNVYSSDTAPVLAENDDTTPITTFNITPIAATPEPTSLALLGTGGLSAFALVRRRKVSA